MRATLGLLLVALSLSSCDPKHAPPPPGLLLPPMPLGGEIKMSDLTPDASPGEKALLRLGTTKLPVKVRQEKKDGVLTVQLVSSEVVIESEVYDVRTDRFSLAAYGLEKFKEPLPLLQGSFKIGDKWTWKGQIEGGKSRQAEAEITTRPDNVVVGDSEQHAVLSEVKLRMESGGPAPAERRLAFWFVPGKGLLKREMGSASIREVPPSE